MKKIKTQVIFLFFLFTITLKNVITIYDMCTEVSLIHKMYTITKMTSLSS